LNSNADDTVSVSIDGQGADALRALEYRPCSSRSPQSSQCQRIEML
jgi:hypothetical protein